MTKALEIYQREDGFYVGRECKNGSLAKGAYHITGDDIMTMFTTFFNDHCADTGTNQMLMQEADGTFVLCTRIKNEKGE